MDQTNETPTPTVPEVQKVKAKFACSWVQQNDGSVTAHFYAVYSDTGENADFAKATPGGNISMQIDNETPASNFFKQGSTYYLNFELAPTN